MNIEIDLRLVLICQAIITSGMEKNTFRLFFFRHCAGLLWTILAHTLLSSFYVYMPAILFINDKVTAPPINFKRIILNDFYEMFILRLAGIVLYCQ